MGDAPKKWQRTNVTNLLRNSESGIYYARVKVNGKEKWHTLKTKLFSVAKLKLSDFERDVRARGAVAAEASNVDTDDITVARFIKAYRQRIESDASLAQMTKVRHDTAVKAIVKTWPDLPFRDARRVTPTDCKAWATRAYAAGTGFVAPKAKTVRKGMAPSSFNKCVDTLRGIFAIAVEHGMAYKNPAAELTKAPARVKRLELPTPEQFRAVVKEIAAAGARQSRDCADMVRFLAFSGARLNEGAVCCWKDVNEAASTLWIHGTKTRSSDRVIPLFPSLSELLKEMRARRPNEPKTATILRAKECKGALTTACLKVGVKRLTHHDLRHLFATRCIESGVDIPTVSRWLGHSDGGALAMKTYGHLRQEHSQAQALKVIF